MTLAIAHRDKDGRAILDAVRERRPPFSPDNVTVEFSELLKSYGIRKVTGDRYGGEWPSERFRVHGIEYAPSEKSKSETPFFGPIRGAWPRRGGRRRHPPCPTHRDFTSMLPFGKIQKRKIALQRRSVTQSIIQFTHMPRGKIAHVAATFHHIDA